jgi:hypothetical protein
MTEATNQQNDNQPVEIVQPTDVLPGVLLPTISDQDVLARATEYALANAK